LTPNVPTVVSVPTILPPQEGTAMPRQSASETTAKCLRALYCLVITCYAGGAFGIAEYIYFRSKGPVSDAAYLSTVFCTAFLMTGLCADVARKCLKAIDVRIWNLENAARPDIQRP
jgi:hypothetical protein